MRHPAVFEAIQKAADGNFLRALAETVLQIIMDADVEMPTGAARHERSPDRFNCRNAKAAQRSGESPEDTPELAAARHQH